MPIPSEQLSQRAYNEARQGIVQAVADNLRQRRGLLIAGRCITSPPEPDWIALANEAINNRTLAGIPLHELGSTPDGRAIESLIPDANRMDAIARDVSEGVRENTGSIGMLQGATIGQAFSGFLAAIQQHGFGTAISGIFNLIFGDGNSESAQLLKQSIAQVTAGDIGNGITSRLQAHQAELGLTDEQVRQIGAQAQNSVRSQAGLPAIPVPGQNMVPSAPPVMASNHLTVEDNNTIRGVIRTQVMQTMGLRQQGNIVAVDAANTAGVAKLNLMALAAGVSNGQFDDAQRAAIADVMTDAVHGVATANPPMRDPVQIRSAIRERLAQGANAMGLDRMSEANRNRMLDLMANEMTLAYLQPIGQLRPVDRRSEVTQFIQSATAENQQLMSQLTVATAATGVGTLFSNLMGNSTSPSRAPGTSGPSSGFNLSSLAGFFNRPSGSAASSTAPNTSPSPAPGGSAPGIESLGTLPRPTCPGPSGAVNSVGPASTLGH